MGAGMPVGQAPLPVYDIYIRPVPHIRKRDADGRCLRGEMEQRGAQPDRGSCPVCLDPLRDPVAVPCGHRYCMDCIKPHWDAEDQVYSCPLCRKTFTTDHRAAAESQVRDQLQDVLRDSWTDVSLAAEPEIRAQFLQDSHDVTLDPNTAHKKLLLSAGDRKVTVMGQRQSYPAHPDRFSFYMQVLGSGGLPGRCYWEVQLAGEACVAVSYRSISRAGGSEECRFGFNSKSWALSLNNNTFTFLHDRVLTPVSGPPTSRVGVFLDHSAGILSFYSVSETKTLLHRVQTSFTQPLYAGVWLHRESGVSAEFCKPTETAET